MTEDEQIAAAHRLGYKPSKISERLSIPIDELFERMDALGLEVSSRSRVTSIWETDEAHRRDAILRRAAKAARKQREAAGA